MDVLISFAHVSVMAPIPYVRPTMSPCGKIFIFHFSFFLIIVNLLFYNRPRRCFT